MRRKMAIYIGETYKIAMSMILVGMGIGMMATHMIYLFYFHFVLLRRIEWVFKEFGEVVKTFDKGILGMVIPPLRKPL